MAPRLPQLQVLPLPLLGVDLFIIMFGGYWDAGWHRLNIPETFWSPPHIVLYVGVGLLGLDSFLGLILRKVRSLQVRVYSIVAVGFVVQVLAGAWDQWWHSQFGIDQPASPPHLLLLAGITLSSFGLVLSRFQTHLKLEAFTKLAGLVSLWLTLNFVPVILLGGFRIHLVDEKIVLDNAFHLTGVVFLLSARSVLHVRLSATLLSLLYMAVEYTTVVLLDPSIAEVAIHYPVIVFPALVIDFLHNRIPQLGSHTFGRLLMGGFIAVFYFYAYYPLNAAYFLGWVPIDYASVSRAFLAGAFGASMTLPLFRRGTARVS